MIKREAAVWMPLYWKDLFADTEHLDTLEFGVYMRLLGVYWMRRGPLPDDDKFLTKAARLTNFRWKSLKISIAPFFQIGDGSWKHKRMEIELDKSCERIQSARASAYARHHANDMLITITKNNNLKVRDSTYRSVDNGDNSADGANGAARSRRVPRSPPPSLAESHTKIAREEFRRRFPNTPIIASPKKPNGGG